MSLVAVLEALASAGATPDMMVAAARALEAGKTTNAQRQAAYRARKAAEKQAALQSVVTVTTDNNAETQKVPSPPSPIKQINPIPPNLQKHTPGERETRIAADWTPSEDGTFYAHGKIGVDRTLNEIEKFRDFWKAKAGPNGRKRDWDATWRTWVRNALERQTARGTGPPRAKTFADLARELPLDPCHERDHQTERHESHATGRSGAGNGRFDGRFQNAAETRGGDILDLRPEFAVER